MQKIAQMTACIFQRTDGLKDPKNGNFNQMEFSFLQFFNKVFSFGEVEFQDVKLFLLDNLFYDFSAISIVYL